MDIPFLFSFHHSEMGGIKFSLIPISKRKSSIEMRPGNSSSATFDSSNIKALNLFIINYISHFLFTKSYLYLKYENKTIATKLRGRN